MRKGYFRLTWIFLISLVLLLLLFTACASVEKDGQEDIIINSADCLLITPGTEIPCREMQMDKANEMNLETGEDWLAEMALPEGFRQDARSLLYCKDEEETFSILQGDSSTYVGDDGERIYIARSKRKETLGNVTLYVDYKDYEVESSFMNGVEMRIFGDEDTELYRAEFYLDSLYYYVQGSDISEETYLNVLRCLCGEDR